ncbi:MAG TPA: response regulator transcription factor [Candidatus Sulfotelmatobacter sp.]|nr:response regulator transcription factor [Candidatus Sulfotelmatobacter sp.]
MRYRILLADDQRILTEGLAIILAQHYDVVATARNGHELVFLAKERNPDVIITEISLPQLNSLDALQVLRKAGLKSKFVMLTMYLDVNLAIEAFRAGVSGYVVKLASKDEVIAAVENAVHGRTYLSSGFPVDLVSILSEAVRRPAGEGLKLTRRQREVLQLVAEGKTMKEVAMVLSISTRTAESYKYEIMRILGVHSNAALVHYAIRIGLITVPPLRLAA